MLWSQVGTSCGCRSSRFRQNWGGTHVVGFGNANRGDGLLSKKEYEESKEFQEGEQELRRLKNLSLNSSYSLDSLDSFFAHAACTACTRFVSDSLASP